MTDALSEKEVLSYVHGPYQDLVRAQDACDLMVGSGPFGAYSVVELFGEGYDRPASDSSGETWGELWAVPFDLVPQFAAIKGVEMHQIVDTFGNDTPEERNK